MLDINLLPQEFKPKAYIVQLAKTLNKFTLVAVSVFLVVAILFISLYFFFLQKNRTLAVEQEKLISEIKALQASEQRLVLVKDRVGKVEKVLAKVSTEFQIPIVTETISDLPENLNIDSLSIEGKTIKMQIKSLSLVELGRFLEKVVSSGNFKSIKFDSFRFDPKSGYSIALIFSR